VKSEGGGEGKTKLDIRKSHEGYGVLQTCTPSNLGLSGGVERITETNLKKGHWGGKKNFLGSSGGKRNSCAMCLSVNGRRAQGANVRKEPNPVSSEKGKNQQASPGENAHDLQGAPRTPDTRPRLVEERRKRGTLTTMSCSRISTPERGASDRFSPADKRIKKVERGSGAQ